MTDSFYLDVGQHIESGDGYLYRNLQLLGKGGNANTYLVVATSGPHRGVPFAIKVFRNLSRPERGEAFLKEVEFLQECDHPSIMRVFDRGSFEGRFPFVVAEYLPYTLQDVVQAKRQTPVVAKISYALQLLSALAHLDQLRPAVIHRDIKPQNVFVKGRSCVLGDFGLLKLANADTDREVFKESVGAGMPYRYRTPDQVAYLRGEAELTTKSDVFQLGLVLAELFTGRNPERLCVDMYNDDVALDPIGAIHSSFSDEIADVISQMLEFAPAKRLSSIQFLDMWDGIFKVAVRQKLASKKRIW
ncbi:MAG: serine/threonine-protein kinase [Planctomycetia bacterium]|nr:serine/threonine-protein kinase [Planctomycetia bacterium]